MALLLLLREYLGKRERGEKEREREGEGEGDQERGREERGRERERKVAQTWSHMIMSVTLPVRKLSHTTQSCVYCH